MYDYTLHIPPPVKFEYLILKDQNIFIIKTLKLCLL